LKPGTTTVTLERGDTTLVIKEVPALVCDTCNEGYTNGPTTDRVLAIGEQAAAQGVEVDVRRYVPEDDEIGQTA
jgi:YgiT-type zinc finger domain-containing protein